MKATEMRKLEPLHTGRAKKRREKLSSDDEKWHSLICVDFFSIDIERDRSNIIHL